MYQKNWAWGLNAHMALSHFVQHRISALSDHFFIFLFHFLRFLFVSWAKYTAHSWGDCSNPKFFFISDFIAWMFYSTPSHSGRQNEPKRSHVRRLLLSTPAGPGSAMIQALNSPLLLCSQLASLRNGQASSTRMWTTLIPTKLTTQLLLPRFCLDIILCTVGIKNALVLQSVLPQTSVKKYFLNI